MISTPEALWNDPAARRLRPAAVLCRALSHGAELDAVDLVVPVGWRLLVVSRPDGAASDLLRVIGGLARPRSGSVRLAGLDPNASQRAGGLVSYVGPQAGLYGWMTPREALTLSARLTAVSEDRIDPLLSRHGLLATADRPMRRGGAAERQRVALAAAVLTDPEVLLLDDALSAVDLVDRAQLLRDATPRRTVLLASRFAAREVGICSHVALLRRGRLALLAPIADLEREGLPLSMRGIETLADRRQGATVTRAG